MLKNSALTVALLSSTAPCCSSLPPAVLRHPYCPLLPPAVLSLPCVAHCCRGCPSCPLLFIRPSAVCCSLLPPAALSCSLRFPFFAAQLCCAPLAPFRPQAALSCPLPLRLCSSFYRTATRCPDAVWVWPTRDPHQEVCGFFPPLYT